MYSEISVAEKKDKQDFPFDTETENDRKKDMGPSINYVVSVLRGMG